MCTVFAYVGFVNETRLFFYPIRMTNVIRSRLCIYDTKNKSGGYAPCSFNVSDTGRCVCRTELAFKSMVNYVLERK